MKAWISILRSNPLKSLLSSNDDALNYFVKRDLLGEGIKKNIINKEIELLCRKQQPDGSWIFYSNSKDKYPAINHNLTETYKSLRILIGKYELNNSHSVISRATEYLFSCQTEEGDIRGILGNQYMPYYCGVLLEYLTKAGCDDRRTEKTFEWLVNNCQNDGGWVIPLQTVKVTKLDNATYSAPPIKADKNMHSSHLATGMVLRAFAAHPKFRMSECAVKAGTLLKSRMLKPDKYNDRKASEYWYKFQYPYWWTTLISALDVLHRLGFTINDKDVERAIEWLLVNQESSGLWKTGFEKGNKIKVDMHNLWVAYSICRILKIYLN